MTSERGSSCRVEQSHSVGKHTMVMMMKTKMKTKMMKIIIIRNIIIVLSTIIMFLKCMLYFSIVIAINTMITMMPSHSVKINQCNYHLHPHDHHNNHDDDDDDDYADDDDDDDDHDTSPSETVETGQEPSLGDGSDLRPLVMDLSCHRHHHH